MRNFISEDDIEQAILSKLKAEPFENMTSSFAMLIQASVMI